MSRSYIVDVTDRGGDRSQYFPAIEQKYGHPMTFWFGLLTDLGDAKYSDQIALLREGHGFSQVHANAVVMTHRGSGSSRRFTDTDAFFAAVGDEHAKMIRSMVSAITKTFPQLELVIAWNQPMLKTAGAYVISFSPSKHHITVGPWGRDVMSVFSDALAGLESNKKTFKVPLDWTVDARLLCRLVSYRLDELA